MRGLDLIKNRHLVRGSGFLNGKFAPTATAAGSFDVTNPATGESLISLPRMGADDATLAISHANVAWDRWKKTSVNERSKFLSKMTQLMVKYQDDLATIISLEAGKPFKEAKGEVQYATSFYELYAEEAKRVTGDIIQANGAGHRKLLVTKQAIGPAALITPWNFPLAMITRKVGPALAAGCSVVIKPAEQTPLSALALCAIAEEAGLPPGVMNCLTVGREQVEEVGAALCHSDLIRKVSFTGSTAVGKWLMRESASTVKKLSLELGGNAPFIVFDDADLKVALSALMNSKYRNAGQACIASNRVLVQAGVYDEFAAMVVEASSKLLCGTLNTDVAGVNPVVGPLIDANGLNKVSAHVQDCLDKGAQLLCGGSEHGTLNTTGGTFYLPTVLAGVTRDMLPFRQETFGPLVPLIRFETEEEAIEMANDTEFGLAAYAMTSDLGRAWRLSDQLDAGMVGINEGAIGLSVAPFGGVKQSGLGREGGPYGMEEYLEVKFTCMGYK